MPIGTRPLGRIRVSNVVIVLSLNFIAPISIISLLVSSRPVVSISRYITLSNILFNSSDIKSPN